MYVLREEVKRGNLGFMHNTFPRTGHLLTSFTVQLENFEDISILSNSQTHTQ